MIQSDQTIDIDSESRVSRIELPADSDPSVHWLRMGDTLVLSSQTFPPYTATTSSIDHRDAPGSQPIDPTSSLRHWVDGFGQPTLITVDLPSATIIAQTDLPRNDLPRNGVATELTAIDADNQKFAFMQFNAKPFQAAPVVRFGRISSDGKFLEDGHFSITAAIESTVSSDAFTQRTSDTLIRYPWNDYLNPVTLPLGPATPVSLAVDDTFSLVSSVSESELDVLANDQLHELFGPAFISSLLDAPEGVSIHGSGRSIQVTSQALQGIERLSFRYVLSSNGKQSIADVDVDVVTMTEDDVTALVEMALQPVDVQGNPVTEIANGQTFYLEWTAKDLRSAGEGVYAAFFDLDLPSDRLQLTGEFQHLNDFKALGDGGGMDGVLDEMGVFSSDVEHPGNEQQTLLRIGVIAVGVGDVLITPTAADEPGHEILLRGRDTETPAESVRYLSTSLTITEAPVFDPLDTDEDGQVTAVDALRVVNFLGRYGVAPVDDLPQLLAAEETATGISLEETRRLDTNQNGSITALDALVIINRLGRIPETSEGETIGLFDAIDEIKPIATGE
ncbi:Dockerin type I repeat protein [Rubripirellula lacrimiformis]|uniref:Dockerin type I repeat protein n=1 Tax=Rubripirellula lacrimiformis TaxID=1930273 RepID=A0A517NFT0_9BACT|nr:Dockerin type I repeat protein [Rubripirellula lacrimiformis]